MIKTCKRGYILNPKTNRCVKKNGKIGLEVQAAAANAVHVAVPKAKSPVKPKSPVLPIKSNEEYLMDFLSLLDTRALNIKLVGKDKKKVEVRYTSEIILFVKQTTGEVDEVIGKKSKRVQKLDEIIKKTKLVGFKKFLDTLENVEFVNREMDHQIGAYNTLDTIQIEAYYIIMAWKKALKA
jgi:hypothetical protein